MATPVRLADPKEGVRSFWDAEPCGTRYMKRTADFETQARTRYSIEPHIPEFAGFASARGSRVLEIGVGMGADYLEWLKGGAEATGVDISSVSIQRARNRCEAAGYAPDLRIADAERLPFPDNTFDIVYSYGVLHHSPNSSRCFQEAWRVLRPGGQARIMIYHHPSWTGLMLWLRFGWWRGKSLRETVHDRLESPGTKSYAQRDLQAMMAAFEDIRMRQVFSPGDLLLHRPSERYQSWMYRIAWKIWPRALIRRFGARWGLFLLITARKPA
jgi:ubiquinone/menaquinone biosynthesis C-methylase UbiE